LALPKRPPVSVRVGLVPPGAAAWVPLPRTIILGTGITPNVRLMAHELQHVLQAERYGTAWGAVYLAQWTRTVLLIRSTSQAYQQMPFEVEARAAELDPGMLAWARTVLNTLDL
jgi:hypothetical protein